MLNVRVDVLQRYGGRCTWCGSSDRLELDHLNHGTGNTHRRLIGTKLEYWLKAQGYPQGMVQLLCHRCHDLKSGRTPAMASKPGRAHLHITLPDDLAKQLDRLAAQPGTTKAEIVETALLSHLAGGASETMLASLHQRLDTLTATLTKEVSTLVQVVAALQGEVKNMGTRLEQSDRRYEEVKATLAQLHDTLTQRKGWFWR